MRAASGRARGVILEHGSDGAYTDTFRFESDAGSTAVPRNTNGEYHAPQKEAALFFGLFLKGHSAEALRAEIDVPPRVFRKWMRTQEYGQDFREELCRVYRYRKQVLAIFDSLVTSSQSQTAWQ